MLFKMHEQDVGENTLLIKACFSVELFCSWGIYKDGERYDTPPTVINHPLPLLNQTKTSYTMPPLLFHLLLLLTIPFTLAQSSIFGTEIVENLAFNSPVKNLPQYAVTPPNLEKFVRRQYGFKYRVAPPTTQKPGPKNGTTVTNPSPVQEGQFLHGVASGDPLSDAIM